MSQEVDVVVVGAGQAGIAMSEHLRNKGLSHVVLEKNRIAERWRSERWDSLVTNGPVWHDRFPGLEFEDLKPDAFAAKDRVADYLVEYAEKFNVPVRTGVEVTRVSKLEDSIGYLVETTEGTYRTRYVVAATGPFQKPVMPKIIPTYSGITQIHSSEYKNPEQLPAGAVLVVGAGSSGVQIADELQRSGRQVYLSVGPHDRPPRRYRNRDFVWWLGVLGKWEASAPPAGAEHVTIAVSGVDGGHTVDFRDLALSGITLLGRTESFDHGVVHFASDLARNIEAGDRNYLGVLEEADAYVEANGLELPEEPEAKLLGAMPKSVINPILDLDLSEAGVTSVVWATGFSVDYSWLEIDGFEPNGKPKHQRGVSPVPGVYYLGLPWQSRRGSSFLWGVWHDARFIADHMMIQETYRDYQGTAELVAQGE